MASEDVGTASAACPLQLSFPCVLQVGDASLASLRHQLHLRVLRLDLCNSITDDGFCHLQGLRCPRPF